MEYRELGRTGIRVSALCLGAMTWGEQNAEAEGHAQMDMTVDRGIILASRSQMGWPRKAGGETSSQSLPIRSASRRPS
jgi:hypothetical protein